MIRNPRALVVGLVVLLAAVVAYVWNLWRAPDGAPKLQTVSVDIVPAKPAASGGTASSGGATSGDTAATAGGTVSNSEPKGDAAPKTASAEPKAAEPKAEEWPARFDLVRVEPSGDTIVAGTCWANATVDLLANGAVAGSTESGPEGKFVVGPVVLAPGNSTLAIKVRTKDGREAASRQTVTVVVPEGGRGEPLVMLDEPGKPSTLVQLPDAIAGKETKETAAKETAAAADGAKASTDTAAADTVTAATTEARTAAAATASPAGEAKAVAGAGGDAVARADTSAAAAATKADGPASTGDAAAAAAPTTGPGSAAATPDAPASTADKVAAAVPDAPKAGAPDGAGAAGKAAALEVLIRSVEVEGTGFFAQGSGTPGAKLKIYLNNAPIADATIAGDGGWSVTVARGLTPGAYEVRADALDASGAVVARAAVPFTLDAATAAAAATAGPKAAETAAGSTATPDTKTPAPDMAGGALALGDGAPAIDGATPAAGAAPSVTGPAADAPKAAEAATAEATAAEPKAAEPAAGATAEAPGETAPAANPTAGDETLALAERTEDPAAGEPAVKLRGGSKGPLDLNKPAAAATPDTTTPAAAAKDPKADGSTTAAAVPVAGAAGGSAGAAGANPVVVEIGTFTVQRGDNLWRISRKTYGRGIRYTVIYQANTDQIRNPRLIYPGQVLVLPSAAE